MSDDILVDLKGDILTLTLNRPDEGNAATDGMAAELTQLIDGAAARARLVILRGTGDDFCAGRSRAGRPSGGRPEALERRRQTEVIFDCYGIFRRAPIPIIGVVRGRAFGFGCSLAALCDITIASREATFRVPEMAHNTLPTMVMSSLFDRVPPKALKYLVYTTAVVTAERALSWGIVSEVVPEDELDDAVSGIVAAMGKMPRAALEGAKEYLKTAYSMDVTGAVDFARNLHATINSSSELKG